MLGLIAALVVAGATPDISEVVVYPDRARVTRATSWPCKGTGTVLFEPLSPSADPGSFRAHVEGGTVEGLEVRQQTLQKAFRPELEALATQVRQAEAALEALRQAQARAEAQARLGQGYRGVAQELLSRELVEGSGPRGWAVALDAALEAQLKAAAQQEELAPRLRAARERLEELRRKQARLGEASQRTSYKAEVVVSCPAGTTARVELSYLVGGASWAPVYEARLEEGGKAVELTTLANVRQATGEDWRRTRVVLSTAVPRQEATPPELQPLRVWADERKPTRKVLVRREQHQQHAEVVAGAASSVAPGLQAVQQGLSVQLVVPGPSEVPAHGNPVRLRVATHRLESSLALRTAPKLAPHVFRVATLRNGAPFPLLPGPVEVFSRGGYLGRMPLQRVPQGGRFELTFGVEEDFQVERQVVAEVVKQTGLFGGNQRFRYAYRLQVRSFSPGPREVEVSEHLPVSELEDVQVRLEDTTTAGYALHREDGLVTWKLKLRPRERLHVDLAFHVDVPSSYDMSGL